MTDPAAPSAASALPRCKCRHPKTEHSYGHGENVMIGRCSLCTCEGFEMGDVASALPPPQERGLRHDQGLAIAKALRGEISHGKLAEILDIQDVHAFKLASGAYEDEASSASARLREVEATILDHWNYSGLPSVAAFNHAVDVANEHHRLVASLRGVVQQQEAALTALLAKDRQWYQRGRDMQPACVGCGAYRAMPVEATAHEATCPIAALSSAGPRP